MMETFHVIGKRKFEFLYCQSISMNNLSLVKNISDSDFFSKFFPCSLSTNPGKQSIDTHSS